MSVSTPVSTPLFSSQHLRTITSLPVSTPGSLRPKANSLVNHRPCPYLCLRPLQLFDDLEREDVDDVDVGRDADDMLDATPMTCPTPVNPDGMHPAKSVSATVSPLAVRTSFWWSAPELCSARKSAGGGPGFGRSWPFGTGSSCKYAPAASLGAS